MMYLKKTASLFTLSILCISVTANATESTFTHPGGLHTQTDLERMKAKVAAGEHPWIDGWNLLIQDRKAQSDYKAAPHRHMASRQRAQDDATAAYLNALRWIISGEQEHADCAARILNDWAATVSEIPHGSDQPGLSGIPIGTFAIAAELLRPYSGWSAEEQQCFKTMLLNYMYPVCHDFLENHNGTPDSNYWANWDTCNMRAILAIGVYCDDRAKFNEAVDYFKHGRGMGSIENAVPFLYPGVLGQWQESGRDQAHVMGGQGLLAEMCQIAWNQNIDLFSYAGNRLLAGAEYTAQYNLWKSVPYTFYNNSSEARQCYVSQNYHGRLDASHFELLYNHYVVRQGLSAPSVQQFAELRRPEPGEIDVLGYGSLVYTLDAEKSPLLQNPPPTPLDLRAEAGLNRIELNWSPSGAYTAHGYAIARATTQNGPFEPIYSTSRWTTPSYTDTDVEAGQTYFYTVSALNNAGKSKPSAIVSATPVETAPHAFIVPGSGSGLEGHLVGESIKGDFCLTARLIAWEGPVGMMGLAVREKNKNTAALTLTLGETGGRQTRFRTPQRTLRGNDYTWLPEWFRLQRDGNDFTAYQSDDGIEWFLVGETHADLPKNLLAGLLVSTGKNPPYTNKEDPPKGFFDHVTLVPSPPAPPSPPTRLSARYRSDCETVQMEWNNAKGAQTVIKIEASINGAPFCEIVQLPGTATCFNNTGIKNPKSIRYRIRAGNGGGHSAYSNTTSP